MDTPTATRAGQESRLGLERVTELLERLGNPHRRLKYVHVAGTNGKGSVCVMLASVLRAAGYRTGLYTSPFINEFGERIQVDGVSIGFEDLSNLTARVQGEADQMADSPTEFELVTAMAFLHFCEVGCDIVVLEVGLGGRLDATNAIPPPEVAVITPVSLDHVAELGDTLEKIAREKAGILKPGTQAVTSPQAPAAAYAIRKQCRVLSIPLVEIQPAKISITESTLAGLRFSYRGYKNLRIRLLGTFQTQNAAVAIDALYALRRRGWVIKGDAVRRGLESAAWPARFEVLHRAPWFIVDGGHNLQCVDSLVDNLHTYFPGKRVSFITGVMKDKDFKAMFGKILPIASRIYTVTPDNPRALDAVDLAAFFKQQGVHHVRSCHDIEEAIGAAARELGNDEVICAFGSFYMAGAIRALFGY